MNSANNLDKVAIIDLRGPDPGAFHDAYRSWAIRARLEREHGTYANQVIWFGAVPLMGDPNYATEGILAMDRWLAAVESDNGTGSLAAKIIRDRPGDVKDRCSQVDGPGAGLAARHRPDLRAEGRPDQVRHAADGRRRGRSRPTSTSAPSSRCGASTTTRSHSPTASGSASLRAFPAGVCDWSRPGVDQVDTIPWQTYQDGSGSVIYGGRPLGAAPAGSGGGWTSAGFASWRG